MSKKLNIPQKGAGRKWAARLKELGKQPPPQKLIDAINKKKENKDKQVAALHQSEKEVDL